MILIADGGSTKTEWRVIENGIAGDSLFTSGINPFFLSTEEIWHLLREELHMLSGKSFSRVVFYGTGCSNKAKEGIVKSAIEKFFLTENIFIGSDLLGAARALCLNEPGIACIMGTGSNSCYYDGTRIASNVAPLGYILGDEGGAAVLGRKLLSGVLKKQVPQIVIDKFFETYALSPADILENVYMKPFPNRFLGQFAKFISLNIDIPELQHILTSSFDEFIRRNILQYPEAENLPVHFTGSVAWHFKSFLEASLATNNLKAGTISQSPMNNLIRFHEINPAL
jgi:glucosamine kinase